MVRVVRDLWDSWDDDAVIRDTATGRYIDRDRLHYVDFTSGGAGPFAGPDLRGVPDGARAPFTVKGPLIVPRGPQGQPVVVARAGTAPLDLVDIALVDAPEASGAPRTFLDLHVTLDTAAASAADRLAALEDARPLRRRPAVDRLGRRARRAPAVAARRGRRGPAAPVRAGGGPARARPLGAARPAGRPRDPHAAAGRHPARHPRPPPSDQPLRHAPGDLVTDLPRPHAHVHFGVFFQGVNHSTIWSDPASGSQTDFESFRQIVQTAERGLFDAFFLGEGLRLREQNGGCTTSTSSAGPTRSRSSPRSPPSPATSAWRPRRTSPTTTRPTSRAGWPASTCSPAAAPRGTSSPPTTPGPGENFRRGGWLDHDLRYVRAGEFVRAAQAIWDGDPRRAGHVRRSRRWRSRSRPRVPPQPAGPPGAVPGRRLPRGPRLRGGARRGHLLGARDRTTTTRSRSPPTSGPARVAAGPARGRPQDPARHAVHPRRHRRRGVGEGALGQGAAGHARHGAVAARSGVGRGPLRVRPRRSGAQPRPGDRRDRPDPRDGAPRPRPARDRPGLARPLRGREPLASASS